MKIDFQSKSYKFKKKEFDKFFEEISKSSTYTQGKNLSLFEDNLRKYLGAKNCVVTSNAVSAMELIVNSINLKSNDEIIIPAHTYVASAYPFLRKTKNIKWADIDIDTRVSDLKYIKKLVTKNTRVIVVVHLYGYMVNIKPIAEFAKKNNIILIEDAAQSIGCKINGKHASTFGDYAIISFQSQKNLTTLGEGGCLIYKNNKLNKFFKNLRHNGHESYLNQKNYWKPAMTNAVMPKLNNNLILPHNFCLPEINCIAGNLLLKKIDKFNQKKRINAKYFITKLESIKKYISFNEDYTTRNNYHLLVGYCKNINRDKLISILNKKYQIKCIVQYYPLYKYDLFKKVKKQKCQNTEIFYNNMISIPFHLEITNEELNYIASSFIKSVNFIKKK